MELLSVNFQWSPVIFTEAKETIKHTVDELISKGYCKAVAVTHHFYCLNHPAWATERTTEKLWFESYISGYRGDKVLGWKGGHSLISSVEFTKTWSNVFILPYAFTMWYLIKHRRNFYVVLNKVIINRV